jgi:type I restriction enzyme S subunit
MKRYPAYKDSGVEWLGEVPEGWEVKRFKNLLREREERSQTGDELLLSVSAYTGVTPRAENIDDGEFLSRAESLEGYKVCYPNDLVMNIMLAWNRAQGISRHHGIVSPAYAVFACGADIRPAYLDYLVRSNEYCLYFKAHSAGVIDSRLRLYPEVFGALTCLLPPLPEQRAIAGFLDREVVKLDALVAEQRRLIALLAEKRQAVISHAVTRGLDPNVPLKPSGIDWLGDIPEGWEVVRIKNVARMESGHTPDKQVPAYWDGGDISWVSLNDTGYLKDHEYISETAYSVTQAGIDNSSARLLPAGVVVFSRDATIGRCAITTKEMAVSQHFIAWVCGPRISNQFLLYCLRAMQQELERMTFGATLKTIGMPDIRKLSIALPPLDKQHEIVRRVREQVTEIDQALDAAQSAISLLQERRAALISAAVTGKIDVRDLAPTPEPEPA